MGLIPRNLLISKELSFESKSEIDIPLNTLVANPLILKTWSIRKIDPLQLDQITSILDSVYFTEIKRTAGAGTVTLILQYNDDLGNWGDFMNITGVDPAYTTKYNSGNKTGSWNETTQFRLIAYNTNGTTSGKVQNLKVYFRILLPIGYSL